MSTATAPIYQAALDRGLSIIPVDGKKPIGLDWPDRARNSADVMNGHEGNYGVMATEEFCILDVDDLEKFRAIYPVDNLWTFTVRSSSDNKRHYYFRHSRASRALGNFSRSGLFDFWALRKQVVGPGSVHPSGAVYTIVNDADITEIPDDLVAAMAAVPSQQGSGVGCDRQQFCRDVWRLWRGDEDAFRQAVLDYAADKAWSAGDVERMIQSTMKKETWKEVPKAVVGAPKVLLQGSPTKGSRYDWVFGPREGDKHGIFNLGQFHLVQGPADAGKSILTIGALIEQQKKLPVFDRQTYGYDFLIIQQDRGRIALELTLDGMGLLDNPPPFDVADGEDAPVETVEKLFLARSPRPKIIFIEGLDLWIVDIKDMKLVARVCKGLLRLAEHYHISVIASVGSPKFKGRERYESGRDRAIGSTAWGRTAASVLDVTIDPSTEIRKVEIMPKTGARRQRFDMRFGQDGWLHVYEPIKVVIGSVEDLPDPKDVARARGVGLRQGQKIVARMKSELNELGVRELGSELA